ncbi:MAG: maleylpyruvate isomerase N-terminal domain-containing protein [Actinomycetota bacterium]|nr:maleylpyruvate isomerase N-terminal domain-containing protein [Actinomycetota bacterium]
MTSRPAVDWAAACRVVAVAGPRFSALLRSARRPTAPALGTWDVTEVAVHVSHSVDTTTAMANGGGNLLDDIWGLASLSGVMVNGEGRRSLAEVADRIDASVASFLSAMDAATSGEESRPWLVRGTEMTLSSLTCEILSELTVHGWDIARAEGVPWPIDRSHATMIVEGFLLPSLHVLGRSMVDQRAAAGVRARFEIRVRGGGRAWLRFHYGDLSVEAAPSGPVDCHLLVDPVAFLLVSWGRSSQWPPIARGQLLAWGRKPWFGLRLRSWLRNP